MPTPREESVPQKLRPTFEAITRITDAVCTQHLTDEYVQLARKLTATLCRKRPSPLASGKVESWAAGILYALGTVNFLFDKSQSPHLRADELCALLGVSKSTASAKAKTIRDLLDMVPLDPAWCLPSKLADNPLAWMIQVNGLIMDARTAPRAIQEEAFRRGLIPYIPEHA